MWQGRYLLSVRTFFQKHVRTFSPFGSNKKAKWRVPRLLNIFITPSNYWHIYYICRKCAAKLFSTWNCFPIWGTKYWKTIRSINSHVDTFVPDWQQNKIENNYVNSKLKQIKFIYIFKLKNISVGCWLYCFDTIFIVRHSH